MTEVFADTSYWIAKINPHDQWHQDAIQAEYRIGIVQLVTTESVFVEVLNYFSSYHRLIRKAATDAVQRAIDNPQVQFVRQRQQDFSNGIDLYASREDKDYSLTDCLSR